MKFVGIALLFALCALLGAQAARRMEARIRAFSALGRDLDLLLSLMRVERAPLQSALQRLPDGLLKDTLSESSAPLDAPLSEEERELLTAFSRVVRAGCDEQIEARAAALRQMTERVLREEEATRRDAKLLRLCGTLSGAVLAILLW